MSGSDARLADRMTRPTPNSGNLRPELRMLVAPVRSGTTAFMHSVAQNVYVDTASGAMKRHLRSGGRTDYGIYEATSPRPFLFYKASFGYHTALECCYTPFRSDEDITATRPVFLLRDPVQTLNSWRRAGWIGPDLRLFRLAYHRVFELWQQARTVDSRVVGLSYEYLATNPALVFPDIFANWGIPYDHSSLRWRNQPGEATITSDSVPDRRAKLVGNVNRGIHRSLVNGPATYTLVRNGLVLSDTEVQLVNNEFRGIYDTMESAGRRRFPVPTRP